MSLADGSTLDIRPGLRVVAVLKSRSADNGSLSDLASAAALCADDGDLVHRLDDLHERSLPASERYRLP